MFGFFDYPLIVLIGLAFGSFVTLVSYRLPRGKQWVFERSKCSHCSHILHILDLIPVFSWFLLKGKCRYCTQPIALRYPIIEIATAIGFIALWALYPAQYYFIFISLLFLTMMILIVIDFEHYLIPDSIIAVLIVLAVVYALISSLSLIHMLIGGSGAVLLAFTLRFFVSLWKKQDALGLGDVKLFGVSGMFLGIDMVRITIFCILAGLIGIVIALIWRKLQKGIHFPFGPAIAAALFISLLLPPIAL